MFTQELGPLPPLLTIPMLQKRVSKSEVTPGLPREAGYTGRTQEAGGRHLLIPRPLVLRQGWTLVWVIWQQREGSWLSIHSHWRRQGAWAVSATGGEGRNSPTSVKVIAPETRATGCWGSAPPSPFPHEGRELTACHHLFCAHSGSTRQTLLFPLYG